MTAPAPTLLAEESADTSPVTPRRRPRLRLVIGAALLLLFGFWLGARLGPLTFLGPGDGLGQGTWLPTPMPAQAYIGGAIHRPGLYTLTPNERIVTLLRQAGGPTCNADLSRVALAAALHDGDTIIVPRRRGAGCTRA